MLQAGLYPHPQMKCLEGARLEVVPFLSLALLGMPALGNEEVARRRERGGGLTAGSIPHQVTDLNQREDTEPATSVLLCRGVLAIGCRLPRR